MLKSTALLNSTCRSNHLRHRRARDRILVSSFTNLRARGHCSRTSRVFSLRNVTRWFGRISFVSVWSKRTRRCITKLLTVSAAAKGYDSRAKISREARGLFFFFFFIASSYVSRGMNTAPLDLINFDRSKPE